MIDRETVLRADEIVAGYIAEVDVLHGVSIEVRPGEIVTIVGPNGAGKSTVAKAIIGVLGLRSGRVLLNGEDITGFSGHAVVRLGVGYVPQRSNVFPSLSIQENLELGAVPNADTPVAERVRDMMELFPQLDNRQRQRAGTLSGGERQMVAMARALMPSPSVLILDEPSAGLSPALVDTIFERIRDINATGVSVLMVEQNARVALAMSNRGYVLDLGINRYEGPGRELLEDPKVAQLYLGGA